MGARPGFAARPGYPGSGPGFGSKILNSVFRAGFVFASGYPDENPEFFNFFLFEGKKLLAVREVGETDKIFFA